MTSSTQHEWDLFYLGLAKYVSQKSKDPSTKTGAVLVRPDRTVASIGFNGFPQGMEDAPEWYTDRDEKLSRVVHAEINAREFANGPVKGCTLYVWPWMPCDRCAVQMIQAGISRFVFPEATPEKAERWKAAFERTKQYLQETGKEWVEVPVGNLR
jgi:dCMP deaminase